ncbi:hypothetical protein ACIHIX_47510 [Streptomyces sp. NPDC051913]|uniref:hypothetical protein n=1 Tax=Streptomyces sp. NPDC051913 TaxID=3365676 RepID=UPI0037CE03EF
MTAAPDIEGHPAPPPLPAKPAAHTVSLDHPDLAGECEHSRCALPGTRSVTQALQDAGYRALNSSVGFPQETDRFPSERIWVVAHKTVAVAAGLAVMGLRRTVVHPKFGRFVLLVTVLVDAEVSAYGQALDHNPYIDCTLRVAACPVGAIAKDGAFDRRRDTHDTLKTDRFSIRPLRVNLTT